ncbi:MAG: hypothetical protein HEQ38_10075 [Gemmatimonas sp.]|uniref:hypothetical protein n=1 Tax=Gemmatimonas sp. TaxID=1962908 RepID=UPI0031CC1513|nr:hypothetical protein [Gemmatimonas sp.]
MPKDTAGAHEPPVSTQMHPVAFLRARPFAARIIADLAASMGPTHAYDHEAMRHGAEAVIKVYGEIRRHLPANLQGHEAGVGLTSATFTTITAYAQFMASGRQIFAMPAALVAALDQTDLGDVRFGDVAMPFPAFFVHFGNALAVSLPGVPNQVTGAYVFHAEARGETPAYLSVTFVTHRMEARPEDPLDWARHQEPQQDVYFELDLPPGEDALDTYLQRFLRDETARIESQLNPVDEPTDHTSERPRRTYLRQLHDGWPTSQRLLRLVLNALVYMSSLQLATPSATGLTEPTWPADTPPPLLRALTSLPEGAPGRKKRRTAVGRLLEAGYLPLRMLPPLDDADDRDEALGGGQTVAPHFRRAHWRRQGVGPGRAAVRLTRIRATLVRPDRGVPAQGRWREVPDTTDDRSNEAANG